MKRSRRSSSCSSSDEDSDNGSNSTSWSQPRRAPGQKPSEVFRTDLITAMKVHDSFQLSPEEYYVLADPWRQDWEKGVQVPVSPQSIPQPVTRELADKGKEVMFVKPKKLIRTSGAEALGYVDIRTLAEGMCRYDLNEEDVAWLQVANGELAEMAVPPLDEITMERAMEEFERRCHENMTHATETEEGLGIEYDEDVVCDVCRSPDGEDNNEMVFCDKCNICVHQACYGIQKVPPGSWLCRICALGIRPRCQLCPKKGGAMKPTRSGTKWVHVSCALWIPEVNIGNPEKMEPITNVSHIPSSRWALVCCLCKEKAGACIQCSATNCRTAFHVTCGLLAALQMSTTLTQDDEVKFKSFCPKHSGLEGAECRARDSGGEEEEEKESAGDQKVRRRGRVRGEEQEQQEAASPCSSAHVAPQLSDLELLACRQQEKRVSLRKLKLQEMEEEFYQFVEAQEVASCLKLQQEVVDFLFQYWKLKRKANFNQPLLTPKKDEEESLARREQEVLLRRLQLFTHLRQDLERVGLYFTSSGAQEEGVRNLTYMVTRREKMKRSLWRVQEQIFQHQVFQHQVRLLDHEMLDHQADPPLKDLEKLFSPGWLSSQGAPPRCPGTPSGPKTKSSTLKREKGRSLSDSAHSSSRVQEPDPRVQTPETPLPKFHKPQVVQEAECRKGLRREAEHEAPARRKRENEQEERRGRKRRSGVEAAPPPPEIAPGQVKNRFGARHLEKTVSIRLVDIRNSDNDDYFADERMTKRSPAPPAVTSAAKPNRAAEGSDAAGGRLRRTQATGGHLRSWGKFRIPKRRERPLTEEGEEPCKPPLANTPSYPKTRHRAESDGEAEPRLKRCHSHQLRGDVALCRRYGSDIIRRGVMAS
ncbi:Protein Jade-1 [Liparis tanakae]|uniref:Protein Jade-1 n=1 Tax=Liparis tanakae TaxID=230148 RepID=A0A4Z2H6F7_9TELE|nr:Protein Jade-1 [Liparis tanakae]